VLRLRPGRCNAFAADKRRPYRPAGGVRGALLRIASPADRGVSPTCRPPSSASATSPGSPSATASGRSWPRGPWCWTPPTPPPALIALRSQAPDRALELAEALLHVWHTDGSSLSDVDVHRSIATGHGLDADGRRRRLPRPRPTRTKAKGEFREARRLGADSYPTLLLHTHTGTHRLRRTGLQRRRTHRGPRPAPGRLKPDHPANLTERSGNLRVRHSRHPAERMRRMPSQDQMTPPGTRKKKAVQPPSRPNITHGWPGTALMATATATSLGMSQNRAVPVR